LKIIVLFFDTITNHTNLLRGTTWWYATPTRYGSVHVMCVCLQSCTPFAAMVMQYHGGHFTHSNFCFHAYFSHLKHVPQTYMRLSTSAHLTSYWLLLQFHKHTFYCLIVIKKVEKASLLKFLKIKIFQLYSIRMLCRIVVFVLTHIFT